MSRNLMSWNWSTVWIARGLRKGVSQTSGNALLKFGSLCDVELPWNTTSFLSQTDATGTHSTFGDNWLGTQIRFHRQSTWLPTMAFGYSFKIPSASSENGLGSEHVDHSFTFGASETVPHFTFDFNFTQFLIGQPSASFDQGQQMALAFSHVIYKKLQFAGEFYGQTQLNNATRGFASSLWALSYTVTPRFIVDGGFEAGLTSGGPHRHVFGGITYSIANLYPGGAFFLTSLFTELIDVRSRSFGADLRPHPSEI